MMFFTSLNIYFEEKKGNDYYQSELVFIENISLLSNSFLVV